MELATRDELRENVNALVGLERLHQSHDEGMLLCFKQLALTLDLYGDLPVALPDSLQRVPHSCLLVHDQPDHPCRPGTDHFHRLQVLHAEARVLQADSVHQLLLHLACHDGRKCGLLDGPKFRLWGCDLHGGSAGLVEKKGPLAEVGVLGHCTDELAIDLHVHITARNDKEGGPDLPLLDHMRTFPVALQDKGLNQLVDLLAGEMTENMHLLCDDELAGQIGGLLGIADGCQPQLFQGFQQAILGEVPDARAARSGDEVPDLRLGL
mmetsp:Transcript_40986/g.95267  ORF Transcript_40986/g.95267 Transcript_40986/m.95267 type:complete len:266 (-) Transcript_40986:211-1008(-)